MTRMQGVSRTNSELPSPQRALLSMVCRDPASAEKALCIFEREGIPASRVNVLVRGGDIEKRWIRDRELRSRRADPGPEDRPLDTYARRVSDGRRLLLEGCWALGPLFFETPGPASSQAIGSLSSALIHAGIAPRDAGSIEAAVRQHGCVWLAIECAPETGGLEASLRALAPAMRVCRITLPQTD